MGWDDAPPTQDELKTVQAKSSWADAPPTPDELKSIPGATPDQAVPTDVFGSARDRMASSFGNDKGVMNLLASKGYVDAKRNAKGDLAYKTKDGQWHVDQNNFFQRKTQRRTPDWMPDAIAGWIPDHPINAIESSIGKALPVMGMAVGGSVGSAGGPAGAMGGAIAGGAGGEAIRQAAGRDMGVYDGDASESAGDIAKEGLAGGTAEGVGLVAAPFVKPLLDAGIESAGTALKRGVSKFGELVPGIERDATERLIERPRQVMGADAEGNALRVAEKARNELLARDQTEDQAISQARKAFRQQFGDQAVDTNPIVRNNQDFLDEKAPVDGQHGALSKDELENLDSLTRNRLLTKNIIKPEVKYTPVEDVKLNFGKPDVQPLSQYGSATSQEPIGPGNFFQRKFDNFQDLGEDFANRRNIAQDVNSSRPPVDGFNPYKSPPQVTVQSVEPPTIKFGKSATLEPEISEMLPQKSAASLQNLADNLSREIKTFEQSKLPGSGDTPYQSRLRQLYGQVKEQLHNLDPEGLGSADSRFTEYAQNASRLGRLENPDTMESFINNYYGKNKTLMRESAQKLLPESSDDIADIGASRAFTRQGPSGSDHGARRIGGLGLDFMGANAIAHGSPLMGAAELGTGLATNPGLFKSVVGNSSLAIQAIKDAPWFQAIQKNPQLVESIANPGLKEIIGKMLGTGSEMAPALVSQNDPAIMKQFDEHPELIDQLKDENLKRQIRSRLNRSPGESKPSQTPISPEEAKQGFLNH